MFTKIKEFLFGKDPVQSPVAAPYKVEARPAGTEAAIVVGAGTETMVVIVPDAVAPAKPKAPAKPRAPAKPKAPAKPRAPAKPKAPAKPRAPAKPKAAKPAAK